MTDTMSSMQAVIFDMDGVLVDSEVIAAEIESEMFTELGADISVDDIYEHFVGLSIPSMMAAVERDWRLKLPDSFRADRKARVAERFAVEGRAIPGIPVVLGALFDAGVPLAVASSSTPESITRKLALTNLDHFFGDHLYSSTMVEHGKPAPDLFLYAARQLGVEPTTCVVIEDSPHGVQAGVAAGMHVVGFTAGGHCGPDQAERLIAAGAHEISDTADDLIAKLNKLGWPESSDGNDVNEILGAQEI